MADYCKKLRTFIWEDSPLLMWISLIIPIFIFLVGRLVSWNNSKISVDLEKRSPYECGFSFFGGVRSSFSIYFFLLSILFLVFDVEIVLLLPLPMFFSLPRSRVFIVYFFVVILLFGLFHEWREGSLDWPSY